MAPGQPLAGSLLEFDDDKISIHYLSVLMNTAGRRNDIVSLRLISLPPVLLKTYGTPFRWILSVTANHSEEAIGLLDE